MRKWLLDREEVRWRGGDLGLPQNRTFVYYPSASPAIAGSFLSESSFSPRPGENPTKLLLTPSPSVVLVLPAPELLQRLLFAQSLDPEADISSHPEHISFSFSVCPISQVDYKPSKL